MQRVECLSPKKEKIKVAKPVKRQAMVCHVFVHE